MEPKIVGPRELREYINNKETYQWILPKDEVSGHLTWSPVWGFHIPCGEEPGEEPSRILDDDKLIYNNNGRSTSFIFREQG